MDHLPRTWKKKLKIKRFWWLCLEYFDLIWLLNFLTAFQIKLVYKLNIIQTIYQERFWDNYSRRKLPTPNPNFNPNSIPNPNPNQGAIFLGGDCPDTIKSQYIKKLCYFFHGNLFLCPLEKHLLRLNRAVTAYCHCSLFDILQMLHNIKWTSSFTMLSKYFILILYRLAKYSMCLLDIFCTFLNPKEYFLSILHSI